MDCRDFSNFLQVLHRSLGGTCQYNRLRGDESIFFWNWLWPAGGSAIYNGWWTYHQVGWYSSQVADAATKIDSDSNPNATPNVWVLAKGDWTQSNYRIKLTDDTSVLSEATGIVTVY